MNPTSPGPRTLDQFGTPHGDFMPDVAEFDRMFRAVEMTLVPQVPKDVRMRIQTARNLGVYAGFSYDLSAVSAYWSITCIEMALWNRSQEIDPSVHNTIVITKFHLEVITRSVLLFHTAMLRNRLEMRTSRSSLSSGTLTIHAGR
jgi:hypothetical protein